MSQVDSPSRPALGGQVIGWIAILAAAMASALISTGTAEASPFLKGNADGHLLSEDAQVRDRWFDETVRSGGNLVRLNMPWRTVVSGEPAQPTNPADPAYDFTAYDEAVRDAASRGIQVVFTIFDAPDWAEAKNQPDPDPFHPNGTFRPSPEALGNFAQAVATRYSGEFSPALLSPLPEVRYLEAWNEPNISLYLNPQWRDRENKAVPNYRRMLNGFYDGAKAGNPDVEVVTGGLAPFGGKLHPSDPPVRTRPLRFLREFLCLEKRRDLGPQRCKQPPKFDILAHHPINIGGGPRRSAGHADDVSGAIDFKNVVKTLRYAERKNTIGGGRHGLWATEFWWQTDPPDPDFGFRSSKVARFIEETMYLLDKFGASAAIMLQIIDSPYRRENNGLQTGLFYVDGSEKPSFRAFRFPFVLDRKSKRKVIVWTIPPTSGELLVEQKNGSGYGTVASRQATAGEVLTDKLKLRGKVTLRATVNGEQSLTWTEGGSRKKGNRRLPRYAPAPEASDRAPAALPGVPVPESLAPYVESVSAP